MNRNAISASRVKNHVEESTDLPSPLSVTESRTACGLFSWTHATSSGNRFRVVAYSTSSLVSLRSKMQECEDCILCQFSEDCSATTTIVD